MKKDAKIRRKLVVAILITVKVDFGTRIISRKKEDISQCCKV